MILSRAAKKLHSKTGVGRGNPVKRLKNEVSPFGMSDAYQRSAVLSQFSLPATYTRLHYSSLGRRIYLPSRGFAFFEGFPSGRGIPNIGMAIKRCLNQKKLNMKTKVLLLGAVVTGFTLASFAADALLSPRAQANQIKIVNSASATPAVAVAYVTANTAPLSPRAQASQIKVVKGMVSERNPYVECRNGMTGSSPKAITTCLESGTMSGCVTLAMQK